CVTMMMHRVKRIERELLGPSDACGTKCYGPLGDRLQPLRRLAVACDQSRDETDAVRLLFELCGQEGWTIEDRDTLRIVRHRFQSQRHRNRQLNTVTGFPRAPNRDEAAARQV